MRNRHKTGPWTGPTLGDPVRSYRGGDEYRAPTVCSVIGITYRQLDYWARMGLVIPTVAQANGSGSQRLYNFEDLVELRLVKVLLSTDSALDTIRKALEEYRRSDAKLRDGLYLISDPIRKWDVVDRDELDLAGVTVVTMVSLDWIRADLFEILDPIWDGARGRVGAGV